MCFSPQVTLATFVVEWSLAYYAYAKYHLTRFNKIIISTLLLLGGFQLMEYLICKTQHQLVWARLGFVMVTWLPVLGLHATYLMDKAVKDIRAYQVSRVLTVLGYAGAMIWSGLFMVYSPVIVATGCTPYYVYFIYELRLYWAAYGFFYGVYLLWALMHMFIIFGHRDSPLRRAGLWLAIGYLSFILPTFFVTTVFPWTNIGFPSVLCGFAIFLSIIMTKVVLPAYHREYKEEESVIRLWPEVSFKLPELLVLFKKQPAILEVRRRISDWVNRD